MSTAAVAKLAVELSANDAGFRKTIDDATKRTKKFGKQGKREFEKVAKAAMVLTGAIAALAGREMVRAADSMTNLSNRMFALTESAEKTAIAMRDIKTIAKLTRSDIQSTGDVYTKMAIATKDLGVNQEELAKATAAVNNTFLLSGTSSIEAANSARQLAQGLAAGRLNGDELRSVMENNTVLAGLLADGFDITRGELKKMGERGLLTAEKIMPILIKSFDSTSKSVATMEMTVEQSTTMLKNRFVELADSANKSFGFTKVIAKGIKSFSDNLVVLADKVISFLLIPAVVALGFALIGLGKIIKRNPIGLLITLIAVGVGFAVDAIRNDWGAIQNFLIKSFTVTLPNAIDGLKIGFHSLVSSVKKSFNDLLGYLNPAVNKLIEIYNAIPFMDDANPVSIQLDIEGSVAKIDALKAAIDERVAGYQPLVNMMSTSPVAAGDTSALSVDFGAEGKDKDVLAVSEKVQSLKDIWSDLTTHIINQNEAVITGEKGKWPAILDSAAKGSKKIAAMQKMLALKEVAMATAVAIQKAAASAPFPANLPPIAMEVARGAMQLNAIKSQGQFHDGIDNVPQTGTYLLESGERVMDKRLNRDMTQFLSAQNGGGNTTNNPTLNFNVSGGDADNVERMLMNHRGKFEGMIRDIYSESAQNAPF